MPRSAPSRADVALLAALAAQGMHASPYQLERWRTAGLLPRNRRRGLGRGRGSVSELDTTALVRATGLAQAARQGRALPGGHVIDRFALGLPVPEARVRAAFAEQLDRLARGLAADAPADDDGWQARHDAAVRVARTTRLVDGQELLDALFDVPARTGMDRAAERDAVRAVAHVLADGAEVVAEELLRALATTGALPTEELPQVLANQRKAELAGAGDWEQAAAAMSLARLREVLDTVSLGELQHAAAATSTAWAFQIMIVWVGVWRLAERDDDQAPEPLRRITADTLRRMQDDPMWSLWGRHLSPLPRGSGRVRTLAVVTLGLCMLPDLLVGVEGYRDRLAALIQPNAQQS
jgi:hypothetical protein